MTSGEGGGQGPARDELLEQLRRLRVQDFLFQTAVTLLDLGARRLGLAGEQEDKDLEQARTAIDAVRALAPLLPEDAAKVLRDPLSQLQLAYAREAKGEAAPPPTPEDEERAKARAKIWTPPGSTA